MKKLFLSIVTVLFFAVVSVAGAETAPVKVLMATSMGDIELELYPDKAPETVKNFLDYVKSGYYDNLIFHRVISGFMVQGGGFDAELNQKQTKAQIPNEAYNGLKNERGTIAMARTNDPHSATSQFFINHQNNLFLNHKAKTTAGWGYTVFGKVVAGMDVVDKIAAVKTGNKGYFQDVPLQPVTIESVKIIDSTAKPAPAK